MRLALIVAVVGMCALSAGCELAALTTQNVVGEFARCKDEKGGCKRNEKVAEEVWADVQEARPEHVFSQAHAEGFKEGFVHFVATGWLGEPSVPPPVYWRLRAETPEGHRAMEDWSDGYHHGVAVARMTGYRSLVELPKVGGRLDVHHLPEAVPVPSTEAVVPTAEAILAVPLNAPISKELDNSDTTLPSPRKSSQPALGTPIVKPVISYSPLHPIP